MRAKLCAEYIDIIDFIATSMMPDAQPEKLF